MHDLGFYQIYELNVDFTERVREEITPLFDLVPDGNQKDHFNSQSVNAWGNGHYPLEDCGPWTQKFIGLFNKNFLANLRLSKFSPTNSYDWHIGIERGNEHWDQGSHSEEPEIYPYQVKGKFLLDRIKSRAGCNPGTSKFVRTHDPRRSGCAAGHQGFSRPPPMVICEGRERE